MKLMKLEPGAYARAHVAAERMMAEARQERILQELQEDAKGMVPREWQQKVIDRLNDQTRRQILWVWETTGEVGKTWLTDYLDAAYCGKIYVTDGCGKHVDMRYMYNNEEFVVMDLARKSEDIVPYRLLEQFKNGRVYSTKYKPERKGNRRCKVLVLANFLPKVAVLSMDRWDIIRIGDDCELIEEDARTIKERQAREQEKGFF